MRATMRATHIIRCLTIALLALTSLAPARALAWEDYEGGNRPHVYRFPIDETFQDGYLSELCGFPVQVSVEGGATLEEVREYLLSVPGGMPAELSRQLRALDRWESTLPIPVPVGKIAWRETTIHGGQGLVLTDNTGLGSAALWRQPDGRIVGVAGPLKGDELQRVVDSIR